MRELPNFADLMLLPRITDPHAIVRVQDHLIHIISAEHSDEICEDFSDYPHIHIERLSPTELMLTPVPVPFRLVSVSWPDGRRLGASLLPGNWISTLAADQLNAMTAAGLPVTTIAAFQDESFNDALKRVP